MTKLNGRKVGCLLLVVCAATATAAQAQVFKTLLNFDGTNGAYPDQELLAQGQDGNFYGTTVWGGHPTCERGCGTVFKMTPLGTLTTLHSFCDNETCTDGANPATGLTLGTDGNFYGTTSGLGGNGGGTVFKITPSGILKTIYRFCSRPNCTDGAAPSAQLLLGPDNNFYGTTRMGGNGFGTVFKITPSGELTTLAMFDINNGSEPWGLTQTPNGLLYGTAQTGGEDNFGVVFDMTESGSITVLYSFCSLSDCSDGDQPFAGLLYANDGALYGSTTEGGVGAPGDNGGGTLFRVSADGQFTTLYSFCVRRGCLDGFEPIGGLIQATDGNIYGTTEYGGQGGNGEIFRFSPLGRAPQILHSFCLDDPGCIDGAYPVGSLLQATNGVFYGTTWAGGDSKYEGTIFSLDMSLGPFVAFVRPFGKVDQTGGILGQGFTGTTSVSFNGVPAQFEVRADTFLTATVPPGATTGYVTVNTPTGVLTSNVPFHVIP